MKRNILIGSGVLGLGLLIWLLTGLNSGSKKDQKAWTTALEHQDSIAFAAYMAKFPKGKYLTLAQSKIDSIHSQRQAMRDSMAMAQAKPVKDVSAVPIATPAVNPGKTTTPAIKPKPTVAPSKAVPELKLGQDYQGGIIVFVDHSKSHGLIISDKELGAQTYDTALKKCSNFKVGDYKDWRLPTKDELAKIYSMRKEIGLNNKGAYWSSTLDKGTTNAFALNMKDGKMTSFNKTMSFYVRAMRSF